MLVVAGHREQYREYLHHRGWRDRIDALYVSHSGGLIGVSEVRIVFTGSYSEKENIGPIFEVAQMLERCKAATLHYESIIPEETDHPSKDRPGGG